MMQKQQTEAINPILFPYLTNTPTHHSLLSLDPGGIPARSPHMEQPINGLPPAQQQYMMPVVHNDQYDQQNSYMGTVPYQQQLFYTRAPGPYFYYPQ